VNVLPGTPEPNVKDLEAEVILLRRRLRQLEERVLYLEESS
jgi:hypothetical protein